MQPSKYQQEILRWVESGTGNRTCNAVAGSGKSSSLGLVVQKLGELGLDPDEVKAIVFGKANSLDLAKKLGPIWKDSVATLHSTGFSLVKRYINILDGGERGRRFNINRYKYWNIAEELTYMPYYPEKGNKGGKRADKKKPSSLVETGVVEEGFEDSLLQLCDLARVTLSDLSEESLRYLMEFYEIEGFNWDKLQAIRLAIHNMLQLGESQAINDRVLDFTDQLWLPCRWELWEKPLWPTYDFVLIDECLPYETEILLADGSTRPIGRIVDEELPVSVAAFDTVTGEQRACRVTKWWRLTNQKPALRIEVCHLEQGKTELTTSFVTCTTDHCIWAEDEWTYALDLKPGMSVQVAAGFNNKPVRGKVVRVDNTNISGSYVYDITVEDCHNFYANGILVHNCQDLNSSQIQIATRLAGSTGRILALGDPMQSILGFSGSDAYSYQTVRKAIGADQEEELPLSICYRCPVSVIEFVREIFPDIPIEPAAGAREGKVTVVTLKKAQAQEYLLERLKNKEKPDEHWAVLCRLTFPLIQACLACLAEGVPAIVKGRDIGVGLKKVIDSVVKSVDVAFDFKDFPAYMNAYVPKEVKKLEQKNVGEPAIEIFKDKIRAIMCVYFSLDLETSGVDRLKEKIDSLFSDSDDTKAVEFSTIHRYKGLQAERVAILRPELVPFLGKNPSGVKEWRRMQERNLVYVGCTRATEELVVLGAAIWLPQKFIKKEEVVNKCPNAC